MTGTEIALADHLAELEQLLGQLPNTCARTTVADRKGELRAALASFDVDRLLALQQTMTRLVDVMTRNELSGGVMTADETVALMGEYLDERDIEELLTVRKEMIKAAVFDHLDETDGPDVNANIAVPALGKKFCREGTGNVTPIVDEHRLQSLLGPRWIEACDEQIEPAQYIPERIEYRLSIEKVLDMARKDPGIMEMLRGCLVPGKPKAPRLAVRDLNSEEK